MPRTRPRWCSRSPAEAVRVTCGSGVLGGPHPGWRGHTSLVFIDRARSAARERLGIEQLRPGQEDALRSLLAGRDTLVVMPSGAGKSLIYQIAGILTKGSTVVVSPLLALQRDQLASILGHDVGGAAQISSDISERQRDETFLKLQHNGVEFVFLAPEQFNRPDTFEELQ